MVNKVDFSVNTVVFSVNNVNKDLPELLITSLYFLN